VLGWFTILRYSKNPCHTRTIVFYLSTFQTKNLEYHVPRTFDSSTPPCSFEYQTYDAPLDKYISQPKRLPDAISIQPDPVQNFPFAGFDPKRTFNTYLVKPPPPVLSVYCSVFTDATQIGMTLPHAFNDAKGMSEIMNAWSTCLTHGIDSTAIPELPLDYNPPCRPYSCNSPACRAPWTQDFFYMGARPIRCSYHLGSLVETKGIKEDCSFSCRGP
jgi:hypothetical protein